MLLSYFNLFLIFILIIGMIIIFLIIFYIDIDNWLFNNRKIILAFDAENIYPEQFSINAFANFILINNLNISKKFITQSDHLQEIQKYYNESLSIYNSQLTFYNIATTTENILIGLRHDEIFENPFIYFYNSAISIIVNISDTFYCFLGSTNADNIDVLSIIDYVIQTYNNFVIIGKIMFDYNSSYFIGNIKNTDYRIITNKRILNYELIILLYIFSGVGILFIINQ